MSGKGGERSALGQPIVENDDDDDGDDDTTTMVQVRELSGLGRPERYQRSGTTALGGFRPDGKAKRMSDSSDIIPQ